MAYDEWTIGGITPTWIVDVQYNRQERTFTITCVADKTRLDDADPRTEIETFEDMACDVISNEQLLNGGSCLQTCNGDPILVSDGVDTWVGALKRVNYVADLQSKIRILYELIIEIETTGNGLGYVVIGSGDEENPTEDPEEEDVVDFDRKIYRPPLIGISNLTYFYYSDESPKTGTFYSDSMGKVVITETRNVKTVIISAIANIPMDNGVPMDSWAVSWLEINGDRRNMDKWNGPGKTTTNITCDLAVPSKVITIVSSTRTPTVEMGSTIISITVVYE